MEEGSNKEKRREGSKRGKMEEGRWKQKIKEKEVGIQKMANIANATDADSDSKKR